jgi:hypothetical protein
MAPTRPASWFGRQVSTRVVDYGWAYRLRIRRIARRPDPRAWLSGSKRAVLLLPGVYETWHFLEAAGRHLHELGHPVHIVPEFRRNLGPIADMAQLAGDYLARTGLADVAIVAHSKGGLIGKTLMISEVGEARIHSMVAINSPFAGSDYAHLLPLRTLREFVPTHDTIVTLARSAEVNRRITSVYSSWDPIIPNGSILDGATNIELPVTGHFRILDRPALLAAVAHAVASA